MYVNNDAAPVDPLSKTELINRIADAASQDIIVEIDELTRALSDASHRKVHLTTYNYQFDLIANEQLLIEILKYLFVEIPIQMQPELKFTVGFGMGSLQIEFNDDLTMHTESLEVVEDFMKKEKGYVWMVGKTLHLVFQVHNKLMAA